MRWIPLLPTLALALAAPAGANVLVNPGFDGDLSGWTVSLSGAAWDPLDVASSASSGSVVIAGAFGVASQCVPITGTSYEAEASAFIPSTQPPSSFGLANVAVWFFGREGCAGIPFNLLMGVQSQPAPDTWGLLSTGGDVPTGAQSALLRLQLQNVVGDFAVHFDDASLAFVPAPGAPALLVFALAAWLGRRARG